MCIVNTSVLRTAHYQLFHTYGCKSIRNREGNELNITNDQKYMVYAYTQVFIFPLDFFGLFKIIV
jgi:hypothetical protein